MSYLENYFSKTKKDKQTSDVIAYLAAIDHIAVTSPKIAEAIVNELKGQRKHIKLIASENYSSLRVQLAMGNLLTDKYGEGFVKHRFYAGCENIDVCEQIAIDQLKEIFKCDHAYVQPHSGADANLVAIWALLVHRIQNKKLLELGKKRLEELSEEEYEDIRQLLVNSKIMGMSLDAGGHLTHGYRHNVSSKMIKSVSYSIDPKTEKLDYDQIFEAAKKEKPDILLAGYSSYSQKINFAKFREIADSIGAALMVDMAHFAGLVAGKVYSGEYNPIPYADIVTSTTHKTLRGPRGGLILCKEEYTDIVNKGCPLILGGPLPHVIAAKAIAFQEVNTKEFQNYAHQVVKNAEALAQSFLNKGAHVMSGGTKNHMIIVDVTSFGLTGRHAEDALLECDICLNRNAILNDKNGPWYTSGIRIGTPAITSLGMKESEMKVLGDLIIYVLENTKPLFNKEKNVVSLARYSIDPSIKEKVKLKGKELLFNFPLYPHLIIE